jgi:hypothetical protein
MIDIGEWQKVKQGMPQGSILGRIFFLDINGLLTGST